MPFRAINSLAKRGVETVADARLWLELDPSVRPYVRQVGPVAIRQLRAAIAAAERWGK
jgi:hypothetical protein